jgi:predicted ATPase
MKGSGLVSSLRSFANEDVRKNQSMKTAAETDRFFVLTGGPGSGKTSLVEALRQSGYYCTVEAGRAVIQDQTSIGGHALPWDDRSLFAQLMLDREMRSYRAAQQQTGIVFFDRGVIDVLGYLRLLGQAIPEPMLKAAEKFCYNRRVFLAPPWEQIFHRDRERKQDFEEAVRTCDAMVTAYNQFGYELLELPQVPVEERRDFVIREATELCR